MTDIKYPPLIKNFMDVQLLYPDALILTEVGKFFEIWETHDGIGFAKKAAELLGLTLTKKDKSSELSPWMAGFPTHVAENYFRKIADNGMTAIIIEQDMKGSHDDGNKNLTRRITRIISPGTVLDRSDERNNYFVSIYSDDDDLYGLALIDVSTGDVKVTEMLKEHLYDFVEKYSPKEILYSGKVNLNFKDSIVVHKNSTSKTVTKLAAAGHLLADVYKLETIAPNPVQNIALLGLEKWTNGTLALANIINYLAALEVNSLLLKKIAIPEAIVLNEQLYVPLNGYQSLDVFESVYNKDVKKTLYGILDNCQTAMGKRLLKDWILSPTTNLSEINNRHNFVESYLDKEILKLKDVYDINRLSRKMIFARLMPHEFNFLYQSLILSKKAIIEISPELEHKYNLIISDFEKNLDMNLTNSEHSTFLFLKGDIEKRIYEYHKDYENSKKILDDYVSELSIKLDCVGKLKIEDKEASVGLECAKGLIPKLKEYGIKHDAKKARVSIIDNEFVKLANDFFAKRQKFLVKARKEYEQYQRESHERFGLDLINIAHAIATYDVLTNFSKISKERGYFRPKIIDVSSAHIELYDLRHPIVEQNTIMSEEFISNDIILNQEKKTLVIYGANSAGKSTILKSTAVAILMNQIGCFIAARNSKLSIFDSILTRMSTIDNLAEGMSTFVMECSELNTALKYSNQRSLFLFDEIGRGTSVEDGEALAYATLCFLSDNSNKGLTLFATHYHSLYDNIKNIQSLSVNHVHCELDSNENIIFIRKLQDGPGDGSYGIVVAKSCGLPKSLIRLAENYTDKYYPVKKSRYNKNLYGTICRRCNKNPVQQTHHDVEQLQGKRSSIKQENGAIKSIHHLSNLEMLCASCHDIISQENNKNR